MLKVRASKPSCCEHQCNFVMLVALILMHAITFASVSSSKNSDHNTMLGRVCPPREAGLLRYASANEMGSTIIESGAIVGDTIAAKEQRLRSLFRNMGSVAVAFSGGVDSTYVAYVANAELGDRALCVTGESASLSAHQREDISRIVEQLGLRATVIQTEELADDRYTANEPNRCFFCKDELYSKLEQLASENNIKYMVDGSTTDDLGDFRPGRKAAAQYDVRSPLIELGISKEEVRELSRRAGLPTWDKPASPCLSSRIAYGTPVTIERLATVDRGEEILREMGFREFRVRHHDNLVRIEIAPQEMNRALRKEVIDKLAERFRELGFKYVTLDLHGYRTGALNEVLR